MLVIANACRDNKDPIPLVVREYFNKLGVPVGYVPSSEDEYKVLVNIPREEYKNAFEQGIEIDVKNIPKEVKTLKIKIKI